MSPIRVLRGVLVAAVVLAGCDGGVFESLVVREATLDPARLSVAEGERAEVTVQLDAAATEEVRVPFTLRGTADGDDYDISGRELVIAEGKRSGTIALDVIDDTEL